MKSDDYPYPGADFRNPSWQNTTFYPVADENSPDRFWIIARNPLGLESRICFCRDKELTTLILVSLRVTQKAFKENAAAIEAVTRRLKEQGTIKFD